MAVSYANTEVCIRTSSRRGGRPVALVIVRVEITPPDERNHCAREHREFFSHSRPGALGQSVAIVMGPFFYTLVPRYLLSSTTIRQDRRGRWPENPGVIHAPSHHVPGPL